MALENPQPPEESRQEAIKGLQRSRKKGLGAGLLAGAPPAVSDGHQVFTIDPREITAGAGLEAAKAAGWRYLVGQPAGIASGGSTPPSAEVADVAEKNGLHTFSNSQTGRLVDATRKVMDEAARLPQVSAGSYEPRLLRIPSLYLDALWLKNLGAGEDLVVPIASKSSDLVAGQTYTGDSFINLVRELAQKPSFDNRPRPAQP